ncbi:MAG: M28 family metallopeptidase [Gammaproteobacteria bacterium]|nr:M28 family metallopeptidase [Gammaproteobacteria bacterium]
MKFRPPGLLVLPLGFAIALAGCGDSGTESAPVMDMMMDTAAESTAAAPEPVESREAIAAVLHQHTAVMASDEFEGRAPATRGGQLTIDYLVEQFSAAGAGPGNGDSYLQQVDVVEITATIDPMLRFSGAFDASPAYKSEMVIGSRHHESPVSVADSEVVFVGYGIVAPERGWNDYADVDAAGKTVVMLVNDPGYATQNPELFNGNAMTWYGRWMYKFDEAARQGAAGVLIVHETGPAGYGWDVVENSWTGPQITLAAENGNSHLAPVEGWITLETAQALFAAAGMDYAEMKAAAAEPGFSAVALDGVRASMNVETSVRGSSSQNVIAAIPGSARPGEAIIYTAHWDHLGMVADMEGDNIWNGAVDNATGTAALIALAQLHATQPAPPQRSVVFLAVTAEESGLLGSQRYAENPVYPIETTVANINMDGLNTWGRVRDIVVIGHGSSELEDYLAEVAAAQDRVIVPEPTPERGFYYRSDHFNFARAGVPALYAEGGTDSRDNGNDWGVEQSEDYVANRYHAPGDEYDPNWDLTGAAEDVLLYFEIGNRLANESTWPQWYAGNEFKQSRDASAPARR